jgi:hypothetical protein
MCRAIQTVPPPTIIFALSSNSGEQFWLRKSDAASLTRGVEFQKANTSGAV